MATRKRNSILSGINFFLKNRNYFKATKQLDETRITLMLVNRALARLGARDVAYYQRVSEYDAVLIELSKSKWNASRAMDSQNKVDWKKAFTSVNHSIELSKRLLKLISSGSHTPLGVEAEVLTSNGTEILFAGDVPMIPEINPIVILRGSDFEMGYQYAQQLIQIFGKWILECKAGRVFSDLEKAEIAMWEKEMAGYAPEILKMCRGWAKGAVDAGVPMTYEDVLEMWTGRTPPARNYFGRGDGYLSLPRLACSGVAAWGRATAEGKLVTGSTGDHDPTHMVTIVAFPETGNNYVYTPFSANGDVREIGQVYMMGHPGMNNRGVAYVEHGGEMRMIEPINSWGYGIRKGTSVFHILRFANSSKEALNMELSYPVGDVGHAMGSVGGFYVDATYGYVLESRRKPVIVREAGEMGEIDFLYANNSALHPEAAKAEWMQRNKKDWVWDLHGGWRPRTVKRYDIVGAITHPDSATGTTLGYMYNNSYHRSLYAYKMMERGLGHIDDEYMKIIFRRSGTLPAGTWEESVARHNKTGEWGEYSLGHATNGVVTIMRPDDGDHGTYSLCVGTAARGLTPNSPRACPIYGETDAFWEITLASEPEGMSDAAFRKAEEYLGCARSEFGKLNPGDAAFEPLKILLEMAEKEIEVGQEAQALAKNAVGNDSIYGWAKATRAYTRAQVRAQQVTQAIIPPPNKPEDLGL